MSVDNIAEAERILDVIVHVGTDNRLEDEAHQRNQQTADDFPPGTCVYVSGDRHRWTVDGRYRGTVRLVREVTPNGNTYLNITADQLWRIDPTR
ncbi:hypothetical protein ACFQ6H_21250 [Rhodococcus sp. NPDC056506]|uniref:hypothetical protein n=1 Tax=Rhodococcus sp. NPDC056506 TaxID=3345844 RepID=UPI0036700D1C